MNESAADTVLVIQHVPFEGPGAIENWIEEHGLNIKLCPWYEEPVVQPPESYRAIVVMGGPMNVHETIEYPWLISERDFLDRAVKSSIPVLGICLGSQMLALALGAKVTKNAYKEIGWFPVDKHPQAVSSPLLQVFPDKFMTMHWHGDTFSIPADAIPLGSSKACRNQGFVWNERVIGLQFHLEFTETALQRIIDASKHELVSGPFIQSEQDILKQNHLLKSQHELLYRFLDRLFGLA